MKYGEVIKPEDMSTTYQPELPKYQHRVNAKWFRQIHRVTKLGGYYIWPNEMKCFEVTKEGFREVRK